MNSKGCEIARCGVRCGGLVEYEVTFEVEASGDFDTFQLLLCDACLHSHDPRKCRGVIDIRAADGSPLPLETLHRWGMW